MKPIIKVIITLTFFAVSFNLYSQKLGDSYSKILSDFGSIEGVTVATKTDKALVFNVPEWIGWLEMMFFDEKNECAVIVNYNTDFMVRMLESVEQESGAEQLPGKFVTIKGKLIKVNIWKFKDEYSAYFTESSNMAVRITANLKSNLHTYIDYIAVMRDSE